jgi:crotonobetainyl-CoA:carnitine CoA-transferase CaiB-like acyl-CoA transferase
MSSPDIGETRVVGQPVHLGSIPQPQVRRPTPRLGEHTGEVLTWLGYDEAKIGSLRERGVV